MKSKINIRTEVMAVFLEKLDSILTYKLLKVRNSHNACTDGRIIYLPLSQYKNEAKDEIDYLIMIKGLNFHELGHVLFTTYTRRQIQQFCSKHDIYSRTEFKDILNMLEDMRIENYMAKLYPRARQYLTYINTVMIKKILKLQKEHITSYNYDWMENIWLTQIGKTYLPFKYRKYLMEKTNTFDKKNTKLLIDIVNRYINLASQYGHKLKYAKHRKDFEMKSLMLAKEMYDLLHTPDNRGKGIVFVQLTEDATEYDSLKPHRQDADAEKLIMLVDEDFKIDNNNADDEGKSDNTIDKNEDADSGKGNEEEHEENNEDDNNIDNNNSNSTGGEALGGDVEGENEGESNDAGNEKNTAGNGNGDGDEWQEEQEILQELKEMEREIKEMQIGIRADVEADIHKDYEIIKEIDSEILTSDEQKAKEEVDKILDVMINEYKPQWTFRQKEGRVNIRHAMKSEHNGDTRIFKKFKPNKMNELSFWIYLNVDVSASMWANNKIDAVRSMAKVILKAFERTKSKVKVVGFSSEAKLYKDWEDKYIPLLEAYGGTNPATTLYWILDEVREIRKKSRQPILHIILTDGEWANREEAEADIAQLRKMGVMTVEINIETNAYHGSEYCYYIRSVRELPKVMRDLSEKIAKRMVMRRKYI